MKILRLYIKLIDGLNEYIGICVSWLTTLMVLVVFYDTVMRYAFKKGNVAIQELEWHIFAVVFLIGAAYALKHGAHVRVDIIYTRLSARTKAWIDFLGSIFFLIPFAIDEINMAIGVSEDLLHQALDGLALTGAGCA